VPLVVGVVGHRNLVASEIPRLRELVREFLADIQQRFPGLPLHILNPLADGADRLVASVALEMGLSLIVPLPMPKEEYLADFASDESREEFAEFARQAEVYELPLIADASRVVDRKLQYAQLGVFVSSHCHILLALWDGKPSEQLGGTAQVVNFHQYDTMPGYADEPEPFRLIMPDHESALVYHIVTSRDEPDGAPSEEFQPLQTSWFTTDEPSPRSQSLPQRYEKIFRRAEEFNLDYLRHFDEVQSSRSSLLEGHDPALLPPYVESIDRLFSIADRLAVHYQRRFLFMLKTIHTLAVLMGLAFIGYADVNHDNMIFAFLAFFVIGAGLFKLARNKNWHRKYLDYRGVAEGMRVQFFWAAAGVRSDKATKFTHDNFLQKQDLELGWIRNVMRVAGLRSDTRLDLSDAGLDFAISEWVGHGNTGQAGYYRAKAAERTRNHAATKRVNLFCLIAGVIVALLLGLTGAYVGTTSQTIMIVMMGILPLIAATRDAYAYKRAEKELIKQYQFMAQVFSNAQHRLESATTNSARREILRALGTAALDEHAEWILMHRERPLEMGRF
jgi:hypothetical protein